ncbi:MAG: DUF1501 domain-containing protein [Bryobacterales bacterium]|nr:DUF1501 domain-containing protein [Bryobacterales bacterium]
MKPAVALHRRDLMKVLGGGLANVGLASVLAGDGALAASGGSGPPAPHFAPKAKSVISIFCYGGPSHIDTFDPKPELEKHAGEVMAGVGEVVVSQGNPGGLMPSPWKFRKHGQSGIEVSELFPQVARHVDDIAVVRSMHTQSNDHGPALYQMNTGTVLAGHPSVGSWLTYGLGSENRNLPGYVVFTDHRGGPINGQPNWGAGFMPAAFQGTQFRSTGDPIVDLRPPKEISRERQRKWLDLLRDLNREHLARNPGDSELSARIQSYELAYNMQVHATEAIDISKESGATRQLYGLDDDRTRFFGRQALMARRLVERGVRVVQLYSGGGNHEPTWDQHWSLQHFHTMHAGETDGPIAGLLADLKQRGLFDETLVVWHGEFGRMPISQRLDGRDHNPYGFTVWLAGGGVKGGTVVGATDQFGYRAVESRKSVYDLHATLLHLMGLDHEKLAYHHNGRDMRLTDVHGSLIREILA